MASVSDTTRLSARRSTEREYRAVHAIAFALCLPVVALGRLLPRHWRRAIFGPTSPASIVGEARALAGRTVPFVFMA